MRLFIDSTELISNGVALLDRVQRDGYALLRGLLPRSLVLALRDTLAEHLKQAGWLDPTQPTSECIANPEGACVDPEPAYLEVLRWFYQRYEFHALSWSTRGPCSALSFLSLLNIRLQPIKTI